MSPDIAYLDALNYLCQPVRRGEYPATLEPMRELLAALDLPQRRLRAVVVAGSSGKGSTCARIARLLQAHGLRVGLYTSPHLHSFRERFMLNDTPISMADLVAGAAAVRAAGEQTQYRYSTFEYATALAFWWFARQQPDLVVLEVGLGGRWDAVNVADNVLAVFTRIEDEHAAMLGGSLTKIAWHKAGIIQADGQALTVPQVPEVEQVLREEAQGKNARLKRVDEPDLAQSAVENLVDQNLIPRRDLPQETQFSGLPGRLEQATVQGRRVLIDGGHTPQAARYLERKIGQIAGAMEPVRLVVGLLDDKNIAAYLSVFDSPRIHLILTRAPGHRGANPADMAANVTLRHATVEVEPDLNKALDHVQQGDEALLVVAGSLRVAALAREAYGLLDAEALAEAQATRVIFEGEDYLAKLTGEG